MMLMIMSTIKKNTQNNNKDTYNNDNYVYTYIYF